jgi:hypothetical protein
LPHDEVKVLHGARRINLLRDIGAAFGTLAKAAFVFRSDLYFIFFGHAKIPLPT